MKKEAAPSLAREWTPGVRLSGDVSRYLLSVLSILLLVVLSACDRGATDPGAQDLWPADAKLLLNTVDLALAEGDTFRLITTVVSSSGTVLGRSGTANGNPARGMPRVVWKSSNSSIARVDESGLVEAVGEGEAVISVASGSLATFSKALVKGKGSGKGGGKPGTATEPTLAPGDPVPTSLVVSPATAQIGTVGGSVALSAVVYDQNQTVMSSPTVTWASANPEVATVDGSGKVIAKLIGVAMVIATSGAVADTASITVQQVVSSVTVSPTSRALVVGDTVHLTATAKDANGNLVPSATFTWSSSNAGVVSVTPAGVAKAVASGSGVVSAAATGTQVKAGASISVTAPAASPSPGDPGTWIYPGDDIQAKVNAHPAGTVFTLKPGVHRQQQVQPKDGQQFIGEAGAIMSGAKLLTQFTRQGSYWVASGQSAVAAAHGTCTAARPRCGHPEDLFIDDQPLEHVSSLSAVTSGKWFFDYGAGNVYFANDPSGRRVELGATSAAFHGSAANVVIKDLIIEKYAARAQSGAVHGEKSSNWTIEGNTIRYNHGYAVRIGNGMRVSNNKLVYSGQLGIGGIGNNVVVEGNEIAYNNWAGFNWGWEGGGTKFARSQDLVVRGNHSHHNQGPGLWTDIDNIRILYEQNTVEDNYGPGIFHEISYDAVIRNNIVRRNDPNGTGNPYAGSAGILISASGCPQSPPAGHPIRTGDDGRRVCVEVYGNQVYGNAGAITAIQQNRGTGVYGAWRVTGLWVHDNSVEWSNGYIGVMRDDNNDTVFSPEANNRFDRNSYKTSSTSSRFEWRGLRSWSTWRTVPQDLTGSLTN